MIARTNLQVPENLQLWRSWKGGKVHSRGSCNSRQKGFSHRDLKHMATIMSVTHLRTGMGVAHVHLLAN